MSTSPIAVPTFSGQSQFAASLQQVITRTVGIASLPVQSLQATLTTFNRRQSALQGLDNAFTSLQYSVNSLQSALSSGSLRSSVSDGTVTASLGAGATPGTYSLIVNNLGANSTALSNAGSTAVTDPAVQGLSGSASITLNIDGATTTITPASSSLQDLAGAINTQAAGQAQATVINVGSTSSPDYRLSLTASKLGALSIDLTDDSGSLIQESAVGALASYTVTGSSVPIASDTRTITLAPGLTVDLLSQSSSGVPATITVGDNPAALASAFSSFAGSFNAAVDILSQYHGKNGGALEGDSIVGTLSNALQQLSTFGNSSPDTALANFGITVDQTGHLSVDTAEFTTAANANFAGLAATLGGSTSGGFLKAATDLLTSVEDPIIGTLKNEETSIANQITAQNAKISDAQARVAQLQANVTAQIVKADAAIAALESQVSYVNGLFYSITGNNNNPNAGTGA